MRHELSEHRRGQPGPRCFPCVPVRHHPDERRGAEQRGDAVAEHRQFPRARRERSGRGLPRQHGLYDQRRGNGGGRRLGPRGDRSNASQLHRQFAHQSHDGHAVRDDASGIVQRCDHARRQRGGDQSTARSKRRHRHGNLF